MKIQTSKRLNALSSYAFADIQNKVAALKAQGLSPVDFGIGDPSEPTPSLVRAALKEAVDVHQSSGYPSYIGAAAYREAVAAYSKRRFGVELNVDREICATIGSKEAIFNFPEAFVDPGDIVLVPNPGYPPFARGTQFAEGEVHYLNLLPENNFLPDLAAIPAEICQRAKILWINYPNNPTGAIAPREFFAEAIEFGKKHNIIIVSDEAYVDNWYDEKPASILEFSKEGVIACNSLSKRSCMTGYRVGWMAGDENIIAAFKKLKTNVDSGTPDFIQAAAIAALNDDAHVDELRVLYKKKRNIIADAFTQIGLADCRPDATLHFWQQIPADETALSFAEKLLDPKIMAVTTPGNWISDEINGINPGDNYVRLALVPTVEECEQVAEKIVEHLK